MNELDKEINQAKAYLRAMKRTGSHKQDCDNVIMHLTNIETLVNNLPIQNVVFSEAEVCDKNLCKDYNTIFKRCKFHNGECSQKQT